MILVVGIKDGGCWKKSFKIIFATNTIATSLSTIFQWYHGGHVHIPGYPQKNIECQVHLHTSGNGYIEAKEKTNYSGLYVYCLSFLLRYL